MLAACFTQVYCLVYFSILKMEATCSTETSIDLQRTTRRYITEEKIIYLFVVHVTMPVFFLGFSIYLQSV
jgi:hypothetical protein